MVEEQIHTLNDLLELHKAATDGVEIQLLREEIRAVWTDLEAAARQCEAHMDSTRSHERVQTE